MGDYRERNKKYKSFVVKESKKKRSKRRSKKKNKMLTLEGNRTDGKAGNERKRSREKVRGKSV